MAANLRLKINLIDLLHECIDDRGLRVAMTPVIKQDQVKVEFGRRVIDRIIERTDDGLDKRGNKFTSYSKSYRKSNVFSLFGKTNRVNLELSGAMKANMNVVNISSNTVTIGFPDKMENDKAHGHVFGGNHLPVRDFFGMSKEDQCQIMKEVVRDFVDRGIVVDEPVAPEVAFGA